MSAQTFICGHPRYGPNRIECAGGRYGRCRQCHTARQRDLGKAGRGALALVLRLCHEGALSEGQVCKATSLDRITVRTMLDALSAAPVHA